MTEVHPVAKVPDVRESVKFMQAQSFSSIPSPWPRSQDLPNDSFIEPQKEDLVLAVSHAWAYGAHPDPMGNKQAPIVDLIQKANESHKPQGKTLIFCDFLSVSQRPFTAEQLDRTPEEAAAFAKALRAFPQIYLQADAVLHVDTPAERVPEDGKQYTATVFDLESAHLAQIGPSVHVVGLQRGSESFVEPFDVVERIGSVTIGCLEDVERAKAAREVDQKAGWWRACSSGCSCSDGNSVKMRRAPFGVWSSLSADQKGWVYLERFASMVKGAMVHEDHLSSVAFATSERLLQEIRDGSIRLREAAKGGQEALNAALQYFVQQLEQKQFAAVSVDKATNTGGVGGMSGSGPSPPQGGDRQVVIGLMQELVLHLARDWEHEQRSQRQRQLTMSVSRGDVEATRQLIALGADPNLSDSQGLTCLHAAATVRELRVAEALIELRGDLGCRDLQGNLPVHRLGLFAGGATVELFRVLAPMEALLEEPNTAGVTPFMRLAAWAPTAVESKPYPPGVELVEDLKRQYPSLASRAADGSLEIGLERGLVSETTQEYVVQGRPMRVHTWQPPDGRVEVHVFWAGFQIYLPVAMQKAAVRTVAEYVCPRSRAQLIASLEPFEAASRREYVAGIKGLVDALPVQGKIIFVDNTSGTGIGLLWELRSRIAVGLSINPVGWFSDDFYGSEAYAKMYGVVNSHVANFINRDVEKAAAMTGNLRFSRCVWDTARAKDLYSQCLSSSSDSWWKNQEGLSEVYMEAVPYFKALGALDDVPVLLLCGSHSPALFVQETAARLQGVIKNSAIEYIPNSKQWWEIERGATVVKVARALAQIVEQRNERIPVSAMMKHELSVPDKTT